MSCQYDFAAWSRMYREEALREARTRTLVKQLRASRHRPRRVGANLTLGSVLSLLRSA
jgi:hypothetical protein